MAQQVRDPALPVQGPGGGTGLNPGPETNKGRRNNKKKKKKKKEEVLAHTIYF